MKINDFMLCTFDGDTENPKTNYVAKILDIDHVNGTFDCEIIDTKQQMRFQYNLSGIWPGTDLADGINYNIDTHDIYSPNQSSPMVDQMAVVIFPDNAQYLCYVESIGDATNVQFYHHPYSRISISYENVITFSDWDEYPLGNKISSIEACILSDVASTSTESNDETTRLFNQFDLEGEIAFEAFRIAYLGYMKIDSGCASNAEWVDHKNRTKEITYNKNTGYLIIIDFSKPSNQRRMVVLNMLNGTKRSHLYVSHGVGSENEDKERRKARNFSNTTGSNKSSLGFFVTGRAFPRDKVKKNGNIEKRVWLKLHGLEEGVNDRALRRGIMMHTADYINEQSGNVGRSHGCPAISDDENEIVDGKLKNKLFEDIKNGNLLFAYTVKEHATDDLDHNYFEHSALLQCLEE